ncbi:MAG TPA: hypothetical protein VF635_12925 [Propionibacteriaceae bacterium]|jgi:hypothetical protein
MQPSSEERPQAVLRLADRRVSTLSTLWPRTRFGRALLALPGLCGLVAFFGVLWTLGVFRPDFWAEGPLRFNILVMLVQILVALYNVLPALALAALVVFAARDDGRALPVISVCCVLCTGVLVWLVIYLLNNDDAGMLVVFLPPLMAVIMAPFLVAVLVIRYTGRSRAASDRAPANR